MESIWEHEWGGSAIYAHGTSSSRGIAVFMSKQMYKKVGNIYKCNMGRVIIFDLKEDETLITIVAIYAPNEDNPTFFQGIGKILKERSEHKIIVGDYNLVLDVQLDRENTYCNNNRAKEEVENLMDEYYLKDIWRIHNDDKKEFSWIKLNRGKELKASRIDFALVSAGLDQKVKATQYISSVKTDHRAFYMFVEMNPFERGTGYWKMNTSILRETEYVEMMNRELDACIQASSSKTPTQKWEIIKKRIKEATMRYSRMRGSESKLIIAQLSEIVDDYESRLPLNREEYDLLDKSKMELEEKIFERIKGVMFRSKAKWYEEGERNSKYFFSLEKAKYNAKTCYKILDKNNEEIIDPGEILKIERSFYQELYARDEGVEFNMENKYGIYVPKEIRTQQEEQITTMDIKEAIKLMNNDKTPGQDGIPVDFYKVFWVKLERPFMEMMEENYIKEELHLTARQGILNLIPKANKDTRLIKNLRPITLLNTDYKIIEKAVANKMLPALEHIIHRDQRGFMKDRRISVNIRKMLDIMHQAEKEDLEAVVLSLDFVKCFDKCSFSILHGSLDFFNFGGIVKKWTEILYKDYTVKIQNNGHFSEPIPIEKGVHQGGCCSAIYFLVIAEILALALRNNENIEGITLHQIRNLLNQFADDMDIFSICSEKSIRSIYEELDKFKYQSGFTVSYEKTTLYRIGSLRHSDASMYDMTEYMWSNKDITVLGVTIAHEDVLHKNYGSIVTKAGTILKAWQNRGLSLLEKLMS